MARILSRRADGAPPPMPEPTEASATGNLAPALPAESEQPTAVLAPGETPIPAGAHGPPTASPTFLTRSKLRRRLRYLRRIREIGFRDLGGLVFDLERFGRERPDLVALKLAGLSSIDAELRTLEVALGDQRDAEELHEPGVSACARCGALHGSEARFCSSCGTSVTSPGAHAAIELPAAAPEPAPGSTPGVGPQSEQPAA